MVFSKEFPFLHTLLTPDVQLADIQKDRGDRSPATLLFLLTPQLFDSILEEEFSIVEEEKRKVEEEF